MSRHAATAAAAMGREQIVLAHQAEHPLGNPDVGQTRSRAQTCGSPRPPRAMPPGRLRSPPAAPGPRSRASVPDALPAAARRAGRRSWRERGAGHAPGGADPPQAVGQTRAGRGGGTHRRDLRRPKGPKVSVLASSATCMVTLRSASWRYPVPPAPDPRRRSRRSLSHATARAGRSLRPTGAQKLHRLVTQKPQNDLTLRATVHRWPPSGPAGKAWPGENVDEPSSPAFTTGPSTATFFSKLSACGPPWTLRLSQFCVQGNRVRLTSCGPRLRALLTAEIL